MNIELQKIELIKWLTDLEDDEIMAKLKAMKDENSNDLSQQHKDILDSRIVDYQNTDKGSTWEEVKQRLLIEMNHDLVIGSRRNPEIWKSR